MSTHTDLKTILNFMDFGTILLGPENKIIFINSFLQKYLDIYSFEDLDLSNILEVFDGNNLVENNIITGSPEVAKTGLVFHKEPLILKSKSGSNKIVSIKTIKDKDLFEKGITSLIVINDIEEKTELEKMKIDFTSQAVHILRTPLSVIRNNLDFLKRSEGYKSLSEKEIKSISEIEYGTTNLLNLIQNFITINEISDEKIELQLSETNIIGVIETALKELEDVKEKTGNKTLLVTPLYNLPLIKIDSLKMVSVLKGIILNSYKHTSFGEIKIQIFKSGNQIIIEIEDNGEGISETGLKFLFSKFYHSKKDPLAMEEGLGIGLYYCKKVIEAHLGSIEVKSTKGVGTKVTINLKS